MCSPSLHRKRTESVRKFEGGVIIEEFEKTAAKPACGDRQHRHGLRRWPRRQNRQGLAQILLETGAKRGRVDWLVPRTREQSCKKSRKTTPRSPGTKNVSVKEFPRAGSAATPLGRRSPLPSEQWNLPASDLLPRRGGRSPFCSGCRWAWGRLAPAFHRCIFTRRRTAPLRRRARNLVNEACKLQKCRARSIIRARAPDPGNRESANDGFEHIFNATIIPHILRRHNTKELREGGRTVAISTSSAALLKQTA